MEMSKLSLVLLLAMLDAGLARPQRGLDLGQYRWTKRIIVTSSVSEEHPDLLQLRSQISQRECEFNNRNLLHLHLNSLDDFKIDLIGYDGYTKYTAYESSLQTIFDIIDRMPMRRIEMRDDNPC